MYMYMQPTKFEGGERFPLLALCRKKTLLLVLLCMCDYFACKPKALV